MIKKLWHYLTSEFMKGFREGYAKGYKAVGPKLKPGPICDDHKKLAQSIFDSSCMTLTETGQMIPTFFLIKGDEFMPIMTDPRSLEEAGLDGYAQATIHIANEQGAEALIFVSENWQVRRDVNDEEAELYAQGKLQPSMDPNAREMLTLFYVTKKGEFQVLSGEISRQIDKTPFVRDSEWTEPEEANTTFFQGWIHDESNKEFH